MLGLLENSWMLDLLGAPKCAGDAVGGLEAACATPASDHYTTYFGLGHAIHLQDSPMVFKVSPAGISLGARLLEEVSANELAGSVLDLGTGSGALAFLLRSLGATRLTASDFYAEALALARCNELLNFQGTAIRFKQSDLFDQLPLQEGKYDLIVFNPPGWRTPSPALLEALTRIAPGKCLPLGAMFEGDGLLRRFLNELPEVMTRNGRAIVGLNSLVGIQDVFNCHKADCKGQSPLSIRLLKRHSLPLLLYSTAWQGAESLLREEFRRWRDCHGAAFTEDAQGRIFWSYEIVECRFADRRA